jgi:phosphoglycolate phosphatase-like HAD superfamily hydrolase
VSDPIRALIFDFDGVILESNGTKTDAFRTLFGGMPDHAAAMMAYHEAHVPDSRFMKFEHLVYERLGRPGDRAEVDRLAREFETLLWDAMCACPEVRGARALLEELAPRVPLFLASVTPEPELLRLLDARGLRKYFRRVFGCPPWNKPDAVAVIVDELGGPAGVALVGDSMGDQRAAARSGVEFIARDSGLAFDPPVQAYADLSAVGVHIRPRLVS